MVDVCDALDWARNKLPKLHYKSGIQIDGERVVVVGWSAGDQLAMSLGWTAPARGLRPPEAILSLYAPTNYENKCWRNRIAIGGDELFNTAYSVIDGVEDEPITSYNQVPSWEDLSDPLLTADPRCRIILHMNEKAQMLPILLDGLPNKTMAASSTQAVESWNSLPLPGAERTSTISPHAQIRRGKYRTPTFFIHGTADPLVPCAQSRETYQALIEKGVEAHLILLQNAPHLCDTSSAGNPDGWKAVLDGYEFLTRHI